jgi:hypothetical protein
VVQPVLLARATVVAGDWSRDRDTVEEEVVRLTECHCPRGSSKAGLETSISCVCPSQWEMVVYKVVPFTPTDVENVWVDWVKI